MRGRILSIMCVLCMAVALLVPAFSSPPGAAAAAPSDWTQVNLDGFGIAPPGEMAGIFSMAEYNGRVYAGTFNSDNDNGCAVWRYDGGMDWTQVGFGGFGDGNNDAAYSMAVYDGLLYVGTENDVTGCEVWSYDGTTWVQVNADGFGDSDNEAAGSMVVMDGLLYIGGGWTDDEDGVRVWSYDGTQFTQVNEDGFGDTDNQAARALAVYNGQLYAGTNNGYGGEVWRYDGPDPDDWTMVASDLPDDSDYAEVRCLQAWNGMLYAGLSGEYPGQVWEYDGDEWTDVTPADISEYCKSVRSMTVYSGALIVGTGTSNSYEAQIFSYDGTWEQINESGFSGSGIAAHSLAVSDNRLFAGVWNYDWDSSEDLGAAVWRLDLPTWYLPEGCTRDGFETWVLVENPNDTAAQVSLAFDTDAGEVVKPDLQDINVPANSRVSFNLNPYYYSYNVATRVTSTLPVVCESAMYGNERQWGSESIGSDTTAGVWYLAEGCTSPGYETWVLVQNPNDWEVRVNFSFNTDQGLLKPAEMQDLIMPANTRASWNLSDYYVSNTIATEVTSEGGGVACERSMYGSERTWASASIGATAPSSSWYLAEGCTGEGFATWVLVQNPTAATQDVALTFLTADGEMAGPAGQVQPYSRATFNVADYVRAWDVSTLVESSGGVVAERSMYGEGWATCSVGARGPAPEWYFAEGSTGGGMETWILVVNPNAAAVLVSLTLDTDTGQLIPAPLQNVSIPANTRMSFRINDYVTTYDVSTHVTSDGPVVCERAMYELGASDAWATASTGFAQ